MQLSPREVFDLTLAEPFYVILDCEGDRNAAISLRQRLNRWRKSNRDGIREALGPDAESPYDDALLSITEHGNLLVRRVAFRVLAEGQAEPTKPVVPAQEAQCGYCHKWFLRRGPSPFCEDHQNESSRVNAEAEVPFGIGESE